jgi:hypothetical protein
MRRILVTTALFSLIAVAPGSAGSTISITGEYVEARTAEVFTGGCIMGSEAETMGRQAVLAWHVSSGSFKGVKLDGLNVVTALSGERNLGIRELGGLPPENTQAVILVDERGTAAQRAALAELARTLAEGLISEVSRVEPTAIEFARTPHGVVVNSGIARLDVMAADHHHPSCGAQQWFQPFVSMDRATLGIARNHTFSGSGLGVRWSDPGKRSAFYGSFSY